MRIERIVTTYYRVYRVVFPDGNDGEIRAIAGHFYTLEDAKKIASIKLKKYIASGDVEIVDKLRLEDVHGCWESADQWAKHNLTVIEYEKYKL